MLPRFLETSSVDTIAEWRGFQAALPDDAADALALLDGIGIWGPEHIPGEDRLAVRGLYCHDVQGWRVFYTLAGPFDGPWRVTVLFVAVPGQASLAATVEEAIRRWRIRMGRGTGQ